MKYKFVLLFLSIIAFNNILFAKEVNLLKDSIINIVLDTINPKISSWGDYIVQIADSDKKSRIVYRIDASSNDLGILKKVKLNKNTLYIIPICELLVGYDYFFVIQANPFKCYISKPFNYSQKLYILTNKIYLTNKSCYINILEKNKVKRIYLYPYNEKSE
jgi:hypothetical protein